jgi:hypothetical protein
MLQKAELYICSPHTHIYISIEKDFFDVSARPSKPTSEGVI